MGTNYYMITKDKDCRDRCFGFDYEIADTPDWGYICHICKLTGGWKPLLQSHEKHSSFAGLKAICLNNPEIRIIGEYGEYFTWQDFEKTVRTWWKDSKFPLRSHMDLHAPGYYTDAEGFDFSAHDFR